MFLYYFPLEPSIISIVDMIKQISSQKFHELRLGLFATSYSAILDTSYLLLDDVLTQPLFSGSTIYITITTILEENSKKKYLIPRYTTDIASEFFPKLTSSRKLSFFFYNCMAV